MKKQFILLPLSMLILASCGNPTPDQPTEKDWFQVDTPVAGVAYKLGLYQGHAEVDKMIYANGGIEGGRLTSGSLEDAADFTLEAKGDAFYVTYEDTNFNKQYLNTDPEDESPYHLKAGTAGVTEWKWDSDYQTLVTKDTINAKGKDHHYYLGTNDKWTTISSSSFEEHVAKEDSYKSHLYVYTEVATPTAITVAPATIDIAAGTSAKLTAKLTPFNAKANITWTTDNAKVTVENGVVTVAQDATVGAVTVTAKAGSITGTATINVTPYVDFGTKEAPITVDAALAIVNELGENDKTPKDMFVKGYVTKNYKFDTGFGNYGDIWFTSDDRMEDRVFRGWRLGKETALGATYDAENSMNGKMVTITGKGCKNVFNGKTTLQIHQGGKVVAVEDAPAVELKSIDLGETALTIKQGETKKLYPDLLPFGATGTLEYTVKGNAGVTVVDNVITVADDADTAATATITAKVGTVVSNEVVVTVKETPKPVALPTKLDATVATKSSTWADLKTNWEYIPNNPEYPNPKFYGGGIKMDYTKMGVKSPLFVTSNKVSVNFTLAALNQNSKTPVAESEEVFTVVGLNAEGTAVATAKVNNATALTKNITVTLQGTGIVRVTIVYTNFAVNSNKNCNLNFATATVSAA